MIRTGFRGFSSIRIKGPEGNAMSNCSDPQISCILSGATFEGAVLKPKELEDAVPDDAHLQCQGRDFGMSWKDERFRTV